MDSMWGDSADQDEFADLIGYMEDENRLGDVPGRDDSEALGEDQLDPPTGDFTGGDQGTDDQEQLPEEKNIFADPPEFSAGDGFDEITEGLVGLISQLTITELLDHDQVKEDDQEDDQDWLCSQQDQEFCRSNTHVHAEWP